MSSADCCGAGDLVRVKELVFMLSRASGAHPVAWKVVRRCSAGDVHFGQAGACFAWQVLMLFWG